jgi:excisionase family DNA binding protein
MNNWFISENLIEKQFLTPKELKDILGISLPTVYRLIDSRKIPYYKIGNSLRFFRDDIIKYLESNRIDQFK